MAGYQPEVLVGALVRHGVAFVLFGGGQRSTDETRTLEQSLDIVAESGPDNLARLAAALRELQITLFSGDSLSGIPFRRTPEMLARAGAWNLTCPAGRISLSMLPAGPGGYADLLGAATTSTLGESTVKSASLLDVVRFRGRMRERWVLPSLEQIEEWQEQDEARDAAEQR